MGRLERLGRNEDSRFGMLGSQPWDCPDMVNVGMGNDDGVYKLAGQETSCRNVLLLDAIGVNPRTQTGINDNDFARKVEPMHRRTDPVLLSQLLVSHVIPLSLFALIIGASWLNIFIKMSNQFAPIFYNMLAIYYTKLMFLSTPQLLFVFSDQRI
jgi:hypothetical protein